MKMFIAIATLSLSVGAFARVPLIVKNNSMGFTPAENVRSESCEVFTNQVVIIKRFGNNNQVVQKIAIKLSPSVLDVIAKAANDKIELKDNYLCDGPSTTIYANLGDGSEAQQVSLFSTGGCGSPRSSRAGSSARILVDIVKTYCPQVYDYK